MRLRHIILRNDGGVWGDDPVGSDDTVVLRSTEQTVLGGWSIFDPAERQVPAKEVAKRLLREGDIIITKSSGSSDHIGKASLVDDQIAALKPVFSNSNQWLSLRPVASARYVWHLLNSRVARHHYNVFATSTSGLGNLTGGILGNLPVPVSDLPTQKAIAAFLDRETARMDQLIEKKQWLAELLGEKRFSLLDQLTFEHPRVATWDRVPFKWLCRIPSGQVDPTIEPWAELPLIAPNHI